MKKKVILRCTNPQCEVKGGRFIERCRKYTKATCEPCKVAYHAEYSRQRWRLSKWK